MDAVLRFSPGEIQVVDAQGRPAGRVEVLSPLTEVFNRADNVTGQVQIAAGVFGDPLTGDVPIARMHFRVLPPVQRAQIAMVDGTVADPTGKFVTGTLAGAEAIVKAASSPPLYLPVVLRRQ